MVDSLIEIKYVPKESLPNLFDWKSIQRALEYSDEEDIDDVFRACVDERRLLLLIYEDNVKVGDVTVETVEYDQIKALRVVTLSGEGYQRWKGALDAFLTNWAKDEGYDRIELMGRKGNQKILKELGYKPRYLFMTKDISHG